MEHFTLDYYISREFKSLEEFFEILAFDRRSINTENAREWFSQYLAHRYQSLSRWSCNTLPESDDLDKNGNVAVFRNGEFVLDNAPALNEFWIPRPHFIKNEADFENWYKSQGFTDGESVKDIAKRAFYAQKL